jgi:hypothetical protein
MSLFRSPSCLWDTRQLVIRGQTALSSPNLGSAMGARADLYDPPAHATSDALRQAHVGIAA